MRAQLIKEIAIVPIGGSEEETAEQIKLMFRPELDSNIKSLSADDIDYLDKLHDLQEAEAVF